MARKKGISEWRIFGIVLLPLGVLLAIGGGRTLISGKYPSDSGPIATTIACAAGIFVAIVAFSFLRDRRDD